MAVTTILLAVFSASIGYATFIESNSGAIAARYAVYGAKWFEFLLVLLSINLIGSLIKYQSFKNRKWSIILFHLAFVIMIIGAAVTRYYGYEGMMHIREGETTNFIVADGANLSMSSKENQILNNKIDLSNNIKGLSIQKEFQDKQIEVEVMDYILSAAKLVNPDPNGIPTLWISVADSTFQYTSLHLQNEEIKSFGRINYSLNSNQEADVNFIVINDSLYFKSKYSIFTSTVKEMKHNKLAADSLYLVSDSLIYQIGWNSFRFKKFLPKGRIDMVSMVGHDGNYPLNALKLKVKFDNLEKEIFVFGSEQYSGNTETIKFKDISINLSYGPAKIILPFSVKLEDFILDRYTNSMSPSSFKSDVILIDEKENIKKPFSIYMNNILKHKGFRLFQSSYDNDEKGTILSVNYDPIGTAITYIGYFLMTLGMFIAIFSKKSFFKELLKRNHKTAITISALLLLTISTNAQNGKTPDIVIDKAHAEKFSKLLVADPKGRVKPMNTLTSEILRKISRLSEIEGNNPTQFFLSVMAEQEAWYNVPMIKVSNKEIIQKYNFGSDYIALSSVMYNQDGKFTYLLKTEIDAIYNKPANERTKYDKELLKLDERINLVDMIFSGGILHIFPLKGDKNNKWLSSEDISFPMDNQVLQKELILLFTDYYRGLKTGITTGNYLEADQKLDKIIKFQKENGGDILPSENKINAEIFYNRINYFKHASKLYLLFGLMFLALLFTRLMKPSVKINKLLIFSKYAIIFLFIGHTLILALRWYISGHAPWSNGYETTLFIAWATLLAGISFAKRSPMSLALTAVLTAIFILISNLSWMDPEITNLVPVLKSYWLIIHVAVITSSYGFFAMVFLMGFLNLILISLTNVKNQIVLKNIVNELSTIITMSMILGLYLLTVGTFLGAVWANESWGRYWGWDPKETWALVTIIVYTTIIHLRHIPALKNNYIVSAGGLIAFASVLMTYFGVNYFLTGMHSYAGGDAFAIPLYAKFLVAILLGFITFAGYIFYNNKSYWRK